MGRQLCYWNCGKVVDKIIVKIMMLIIGIGYDDGDGCVDFCVEQDH